MSLVSVCHGVYSFVYVRVSRPPLLPFAPPPFASVVSCLLFSCSPSASPADADAADEENPKLPPPDSDRSRIPDDAENDASKDESRNTHVGSPLGRSRDSMMRLTEQGNGQAMVTRHNNKKKAQTNKNKLRDPLARKGEKRGEERGRSQNAK